MGVFTAILRKVNYEGRISYSHKIFIDTKSYQDYMKKAKENILRTYHNLSVDNVNTLEYFCRDMNSDDSDFEKRIKEIDKELTC